MVGDSTHVTRPHGRLVDRTLAIDVRADFRAINLIPSNICKHIYGFGPVTVLTLWVVFWCAPMI